MAVLKIYGDIGESLPETFMGEGAQSMSSKIVSEFLEENADASEIIVRINSRGGDVQEGWAIYDLLVNSGKKIKTIGEGKIYSIATIVFLAGEEREIMKNADGLIHNPFIPPFTLADKYESDDLEKIAESLKQEEEKILNFYVEKTGSTPDKLADYMKENTKLSAEDMLALGFATKIVEPIMAYAYYKPNIKKMDEKLFFEKLGSSFDGFILKMKNFSRIKNLTLKDVDGKELNLEKEEGSPAVGDMASPDGSYKMTDGKVIVVAEGKITEIRDADKTELELAQEKIAELEAKVQAAEAEKPDLVAAEASFKAKEAEARGLYDELSKLKNEWKPATRTVVNTVDKVGEINLAQVREIMSKKQKSK